MTGHWLDPVREVLASVDSPRQVFFRDDDAGWEDDALFLLLDVFARHRTAIDLAVIPVAVTRPLAASLRRRARDGQVHLHQHGWDHHNHEVDGRKHEFGPSRSADDIRRSLVEGAQRLNAAFGEFVEPVFTPPWNRCTPETAAILADEAWEVLSRDHTAEPLEVPGLVEIPVTFDWFGRTRGTPWDLAERGRRLAASLGEPHPTGVMLHHGVTGDADRASIDELVALLAGHPSVTTTSILEIARQHAPLLR